MPYEVKVREVASIEAMTIRSVSNMKNISADMSGSYREIWEYMEKNGARCTGECFALYHQQGEFDPEHIDMECGFSVAKLIPGNERIRGRTVEGGTMISTVHKGPYDKMEAAYCALMQWAEEHGDEYELLPGGWRDNYLNDPDTVGPEEILTEILCAVRKK